MAQLKKKLKQVQSESGFTLIELLTTIFIMVMITSIALIDYRAAEKRKSVRLAGDVVITAIRNVQTYTLSGRQISSTSVKSFDNTSQPNCPSGSRTSAEYRIIFTELTSDYYVYGTDVCGDIWRVEQGVLPKNTKFTANGLIVDTNARPDLQLKFVPPFAKITYNQTATLSALTYLDFRNANITVGYIDDSITMPIEVDAISGKIGD